jgi:hypothetical protein
MSTQMQTAGFFGALFDFSFSSFITGKLIKVLYGLGLLLLGLGMLVMVVTGFSGGFTAGLFSLVVAPLVFLLGAMYLRVILELLMVVFRIADNVERMANNSRPSNVL